VASIRRTNVLSTVQKAFLVRPEEHICVWLRILSTWVWIIQHCTVEKQPAEPSIKIREQIDSFFFFPQDKHVTAQCKLVNHLSWIEGIQLRRPVKLVLTPSDPYKPAPVAASTGAARETPLLGTLRSRTAPAVPHAHPGPPGA
jgi:hypothetical protein